MKREPRWPRTHDRPPRPPPGSRRERQRDLGPSAAGCGPPGSPPRLPGNGQVSARSPSREHCRLHLTALRPLHPLHPLPVPGSAVAPSRSCLSVCPAGLARNLRPPAWMDARRLPGGPGLLLPKLVLLSVLAGQWPRAGERDGGPGVPLGSHSGRRALSRRPGSAKMVWSPEKGTLVSTSTRFGFVPFLYHALSSKVPSLFFPSLSLSAPSNLEPPTPHLEDFTLWITEHYPVVSVSKTPESGRLEAKGWKENMFKKHLKSKQYCWRFPTNQSGDFCISLQATHCLSTLAFWIFRFFPLEIKPLRPLFLFFRRRFSRAVAWVIGCFKINHKVFGRHTFAWSLVCFPGFCWALVCKWRAPHFPPPNSSQWALLMTDEAKCFSSLAIAMGFDDLAFHFLLRSKVNYTWFLHLFSIHNTS